MTRAATAALAIGAMIAASAGPAAADPHAEAVVLFDQGIKDLKAGRLDKACDELRASLDLVKDSGTKGALARCNGLAGRIATAWLLWRELADTAPRAELRDDAAAQAAKLEPRLPRYTIKLARPMPDLAVQINGRDVAARVAVPVPIDPGKLSVTAVRRDGDRDVSEPFRHDYVAAEAQTLLIEIPALAARVAPPPVASTPADDPELAPRRHRRHVIALALGGVAIAAGGAAGVFGFDARRKYADAKQTCGGAIDHCAADRLAASKRQVDQARSSANLATGLAIGAGAAAIAAVVVWATAPSLERKPIAIAPLAGNGSLGVVVGGRF